MYCHLLGNLKPAQHGQAGPGGSSLLDRIADRMVKGPERPILTVLLKKRRTLRSFRIYGGKKDLAMHEELGRDYDWPDGQKKALAD